MNNTDPMIVSDPLSVFEKKGMLKLIAPAKTNLFLAIGKKREDGYHEATTVMHALSLHDVIHVNYYNEGIDKLEIDINCVAREGLEPLTLPIDENLAAQAIYLLAEKLGRNCGERFEIRIEKHIPIQAGLGGGSSNAAAALVAAAYFWDIDIHSDAVLSVAARLGSDVSFFLYGGCAYLTGTGEAFQHTLAPMHSTLVLIKPDNGVSTTQAYHAFDEAPIAIPSEVFIQAKAARFAYEVPLFNNLSKAAASLLPELSQIHTWLQKQEGVKSVLLCGSGSASIALCDNFVHAHQVVSAAKSRGWWARTSSFSALGASIVPNR